MRGKPPAGNVVLNPNTPMPTAEQLVDDCFRHDDDSRVLHHWRDEWFLWNGSFYDKLSEAALRARVWHYLDEAHTDKGKFKPQPRHVSAVIDALAAVCHLDDAVEAPAWIEREYAIAADAADLLPVGGGLLDMTLRELHPPTPNFFSLTGTDVIFDPDAQRERWDSFMCALWDNDRQSIETLAEWCGYCLGRDTSQHKILMLVGPTRGGKGIIARLLRQLVGVSAYAGFSLSDFGRPFGLQVLIGKLVAVVSDARLDTSDKVMMIAERLLSLSGEDCVSIDRKFTSVWTAPLGVRFTVITNELPKLRDPSGALAGRFIILRLVKSWAGKEDRQLEKALSAELSGILNFALDGRERLRKRGHFIQPSSASGMFKEFADTVSPLKTYVAEECWIDGVAWVDTMTLFDDWKTWCEPRGHNPGDAATFGKALRAAAPEIERTQYRSKPHDGARRWRYDGIGLLRKTTDEASPDE